MKEEGTLQEINAQPGDVVKVVATWNRNPVGGGKEWTIKHINEYYYGSVPSCRKGHPGTRLSSNTIFRMLSRKEKPMTPPDIYNITTPFGLLGPLTQQALRDHYDGGGELEAYGNSGWVPVTWVPTWAPCSTYRAVRVPVVQAHTKSMWLTDYGAVITGPTCLCYKVTAHYNTIDGVIDPSSYRVKAQ